MLKSMYFIEDLSSALSLICDIHCSLMTRLMNSFQQFFGQGEDMDARMAASMLYFLATENTMLNQPTFLLGGYVTCLSARWRIG